MLHERLGGTKQTMAPLEASAAAHSLQIRPDITVQMAHLQAGGRQNEQRASVAETRSRAPSGRTASSIVGPPRWSARYQAFQRERVVPCESLEGRSTANDWSTGAQGALGEDVHFIQCTAKDKWENRRRQESASNVVP